jgi:hypothetical protein
MLIIFKGESLMAVWVKKRRVIIGPVALVAIGFLFWCLWPSGETPADVLRPLGYLEMIPPSHFNGPGTISTMEVLDDNKFTLYPTCQIDQELLSKLTMESKTVETSLVQRLNKSFNIIPQIKEMVSAEFADDKVKDITISLKNVKILLMTDEGMFRVREEVIKDSCQKAIENNLQNGGVMCQTRSVIEADVIYKIEYEENASLKGPISKLGGGQKKSREQKGERLFYGVRLAPNGIILNTPGAQPADGVCWRSGREEAINGHKL